jgi:PAS domain S-box-containing protein
MLGYSASELEGKHFSAITHPEDISATAAALRKMTEEKLSTERWEKRYLHKSGSAVWGLVSTSMMLGEGGQPEYSLVQVVDITERKRAEAELASSEAKYRSLFEESKDAIYISNRNGELTDINPAGVELFGYDSKRELLQARIDWDLYWNAEDRQAMAGLIEQRGFIKDVEVVLRNRHGRRVTVLETSNAMRDVAGNIVGYRGILHDITQRRELENQLRLSQRLDAVGRLAGGVAHDFNNMLTAILGYTDLAAMRLASDHPVQTYIAEIGKAAERSSTLTRQLLAFSRQQVLQPRLLDLNGVIRSFAKLLQRTLGEDIELISELAPDLGPVQADPGSIEQILMNLAVNARDAMAGGGKLTIETFNAELDRAYADEHTPVQPGAYVCVAVSDTGAGMDETTRNRIFEPFFTTKERGKGIGLGLSTVYGIVKQSGGYVWVYSEPGQGTSFKIYLPRAGAVEVADQPGSQTVAALRGNETILLVEDDAAVRRLTSEILTESGFRVFPAGGMEEALAICERRAGESIDLLITDIVLPGIGGVDLAQRIAAIRPGIKVLYMSGYADRAVRGQLSEGAVFLSKPFTPAALVSKVRAAIEQPADAS